MENFERPPKPAQEHHGEDSTPKHDIVHTSEASVEEIGHEEPHTIETHAEKEPDEAVEACRVLVEEIVGNEGRFFSGEGARNELMKKLEEASIVLAKKNDHFKHILKEKFEEGLKGDLRRSDFRWTDQAFIQAFQEFQKDHSEGH